MLILPLHRALTRANFPFVTLALILVNAFVFLFLQSGDGAVAERAFALYQSSGLARIELPAYRDWALGKGRSEEELPDAAGSQGDSRMLFVLLQRDEEFQRDLGAGRVITPQDQEFAYWHEQRAQVDALWQRQTTERYVLRHSEFAPSRLFGSMFLHGSIGHLVGNMIFLALLGLLVEGALGPLLYLLIYLLGGLGGNLVSLAHHWGEIGGVLGASGAIAALMGAYCVLWGTRRVRFFWWFFVAFDYVKAPALILLPLWLGWELFNLAFDHGANIAFDVHAGGIACGALLAWGVRSLHWERRDFLDVETREDERERDASQLKTALDHLGRLELDRARTLLQELDTRTPGQWVLLQGLYRCARYGKDGEAVHRAAQAALACAPPIHARADVLVARKMLFDDYVKACGGKPRLPPSQLLLLASEALKLGADADAEKLLRALTARNAQLPGLAETGLALAQFTATLEVQRGRLAWVIETFAQHAVAAKARFLLAQLA